jgi:hypothetical protein
MEYPNDGGTQYDYNNYNYDEYAQNATDPYQQNQNYTETNLFSDSSHAQ